MSKSRMGGSLLTVCLFFWEDAGYFLIYYSIPCSPQQYVRVTVFFHILILINTFNWAVLPPPY